VRHSYCVISGIYPPDVGGPAKFAITFSKFLLTLNYRVRVISYTNLNSSKITRENEVTELISRKSPIAFRYLRMILAILKSAIQKERIIANGCFIEIVLLRSFFPFFYITKVPGDIVWERARNSGITALSIDEFQNQELTWKYKVFRYLFSLSLRKSAHVIVPSEHLKKLVISWGVPADKVSLVHNSIDTEKFFPRDGIHKGIDVLTVSRLVSWKGLEQVIEVCATLGFSLGIVGDGPTRSSLEALSGKFDSKIEFFGDVEQERLVEILQGARVFVLNSAFEATSYALIEAMSCGLVPISNDTTGSAEVIKNEVNGILCGTSTGQTLDTALKFLFSNPDLLSRMSREARLSVQRDFNFTVNFERIRALTDV
jgi:glycosyltransferase involved in cell wall biosynthesis